MSNDASKISLTIDQLLAIRPLVGTEPPLWSADGSRIMFTSALAGEPALWSIGAHGGFPQRLTTNLGRVRFLGTREPRISPDGNWIAYLSEENDGAGIWLWPMAGGAARLLTNSGVTVNALSWSPDSQSLAFSANRFG